MTGIQYLKQLHLEENRRKFPTFPEQCRVVPAYSDKDGNSLTKCIIDFLRLTGNHAERVSVTGRFIDNSKIVTDALGRSRRIGSGKWIKPSMHVGSADIHAVIKQTNGFGIPVKIEVKCKATKDRISPAQIQYKNQIEATGQIYFVATDFEQFLSWYKSTFPESRVKSFANV